MSVSYQPSGDSLKLLKSLQNMCDEVPALEAELNQRVYGLFGSSEDETRILEEE